MHENKHTTNITTSSTFYGKYTVFLNSNSLQFTIVTRTHWSVSWACWVTVKQSDHRPKNEKEINRILKAGGTITEGRIEGNLTVSRALGDLKYKHNLMLKPEEQMITAYPDVYKHPLSKYFEFMVMGCAGIFDCKKTQEVVDYFTEKLKDESGHLIEIVEGFVESLIATEYMQDIGGRGCENMTCILLKFPKENK